jgi:hypothetical protein
MAGIGARVRVVIGTAAGLAVLGLGVVPAAHADTINVTSGAVDTLDNSNCSIREAIAAANTDSPVDACRTGSGADRINAPGSYVLTVPDNDANGLPVISSTITISSADVSRDPGAQAFRIFAVGSTGDLTLEAVTVSGGLAPDCPNPGGDVCGGAIANNGTLTVRSSRIVDNAATTASAFYVQGGGIDNDGTAMVTSSVVSGNSATNTAPDFSLTAGGGIANEGTLEVRSSRIDDNTNSCSGSGSPFGCFALGGGIANDGVLHLASSHVVENTTSCSGSNCAAVGGGSVNAIGTEATATVRNSRVNDNTASCSAGDCDAIGGGIGLFGTVTVTNSDVRGNIASCSADGCFAHGGGLDNNFDGTLTVNRSRMADNAVSAPLGIARGGGLYHGSGTSTLTSSAVTGNMASGATAGGGGIYEETGSVVLEKTRVSGNTPDNCAPPGSVPGCSN